jgi:hypothetical protein
MADMDGWSLILLATAAYLATTMLVRLMRSRYDVLISRVRREWQEEQDRRAAEEHRQRREARKQRNREQADQQVEPSSDRAA